MAQLRETIWHYLLFRNEYILIGHEKLAILEERHLLDVKRLIQALFRVAGVTSLFLLVGLYSLREWRGLIFRKVGLFGCILVVSTFLLTIIFGFRAIFIWFHSMLFIENTWWFDSSSNLIRVFPLAYFQQFMMFFCLLSLLAFVGVYYLSRSAFR